MSAITLIRGNAPLILSIPHAGTRIPEAFQPALTSLWLARKDADWHLPALYSFAKKRGATLIQTDISRTVIDLNRDPSGASLYPGQITTGLCPTESFDGEPLYHPGQEPDAQNILRRRGQFFNPYHDTLQAEITRLRALHPRIVLYDCHSIRSEIPRLFSGVLPNFNIGTNDGKACDHSLTEQITAICAAAPGLSHVVNGRFKGGYITRHYGNQAAGVHAIQMELACRGYMDEPACPNPGNWPAPMHPHPAVLPILKTILERFIP